MKSAESKYCGDTGRPRGGQSRSLPVLAATQSGSIRASRMGPRRAAMLVAVHVLMIAHFCHWLIAGRTISPIEPSESMYTLNHGHLNAGFLFFTAAIAATALLGRFVCGWGCHFIAYQDLCAWMMKKVGIKPKPFRSRLLILAPLALALYMFVWPSAYRLVTGTPFPTMTNHIVTAEFWATFPGPVIAVLTVLLAGMAIVYFLGAKGFCTYACPYGGFFGVADRVAPGRIRVTDACEHCGHCTSVCTSNVRVHEEVALYGMVVDPGCMKCMDCVSVCPNDALYFGFTATRTAPVEAAPPQRKPTPYDFTLRAELLMLVIGLGALMALRGLYDQIPLLMAMGLAAITGFLAVKLAGLIRDTNVRLQNLQLKRGGVWTGTGRVFATLATLWLLFVVHSGFVQVAAWRGAHLTHSLQLGDNIWHPGVSWWDSADAVQRDTHAAAQAWLRRGDRYGFSATTEVLTNLSWLAVAKGELTAARQHIERIVQRIPKRPEAWRALAAVHVKANEPREAEAAYRQALAIDAHFDLGRIELAGLLTGSGRGAEAITLYEDAIKVTPENSVWPIRLARLHVEGGQSAAAEAVISNALKQAPNDAELTMLLGALRMQQGRASEAIDLLRTVIASHPESVEAHYQLGMALLGSRQVDAAIVSLRRAVTLAPQTALYHYNLAVATFMAGRPAEAEPIIREAIRLNPEDAEAKGFLEVVRQNMPPTTQP